MTISVLICTIDEGIKKVPEVVLPPMEGVEWIVSVQYTSAEKPVVPRVLEGRNDVKVGFLEGRGLSRNRNNSISMATGDVCIVADDDNRYTSEQIEVVRSFYVEHTDAQIVCFQAQTLDGSPLHPYPADYVCSVEMTFRRNIPVRFNEKFGLGSRYLCAGEEDVFMKDAEKTGVKVAYAPMAIVRTPEVTTGTQFVGNKKLQLTKGAVFRYRFGVADALWRSAKEAGWWMVHKGANPLPILFNMIEGIYKF